MIMFVIFRPIEPVVTPCGHVFCGECLINLINTAQNRGGEKQCPNCRGEINRPQLVPFAMVEEYFKIQKRIDEGGDDEAAQEEQEDEQEDDDDEKEDEVKDEKFDELRPSTKIKQLMEELERVRIEHPEEKTIIFCSFTKMLDLCENSLNRRGFNFVRVWFATK